MEIKTQIPLKPFYFIRHGQTDWNKENKVMGQIDIPLNAVGLKQAQIVAQNIAHIELSCIISSPLKRAKQTSEIIAETLKRPVAVVEELNQNALGIMEGRNKAELLDGITIGDLIEHWKMGANIDIEGAEPRSDFVSRVAVGLCSAVALGLNHNEKPILIVAHQPVYWALLQILNVHDCDRNAKNCGLYYFSPSDLVSNRWLVNVSGDPF